MRTTLFGILLAGGLVLGILALVVVGTPSNASAVEQPPTTCLWDLNGDGVVSEIDVLIARSKLGMPSSGPPDFDGDGFVTVIDLRIVIIHFGLCGEPRAPVTPPLPPLPEPAFGNGRFSNGS